MTTHLPGRILAAPSWVMPAGVAKNCRFLAGRVDEVGLLFLETESSLAYTQHDLPPDLADLPLAWHVHLPVDLPWGGPLAHTAQHDGKNAAQICIALMEKVCFLGAKRAVLHPPAHSPNDYAQQALDAFATAWYRAGRHPGDILLENIRGQSLTGLSQVIRAHNLSVCLDTGHLLSYAQKDILHMGELIQRIRMLHCNVEIPGGRHLPLTTSDTAMEQLCRHLFTAAPCDSVIMLELFAWNDIEASLPLLHTWLVESTK